MNIERLIDHLCIICILKNLAHTGQVAEEEDRMTEVGNSYKGRGKGVDNPRKVNGQVVEPIEDKVTMYYLIFNLSFVDEHLSELGIDDKYN